MAGICGAIGIENKALLKRMVSLMAHRGEIIDVFADNGVTIALIRRANEPELYNKGLTSIALDQDIYAIGNRLIKDNPDIYIHLAARASAGETLKTLRGSFALAIVNGGKRYTRLTLARDIYGTRSIYYLQTSHALFFASEMKCFLAIDEFKPEVSSEALNHYLSCGFTSERQTLLKQVYKVLPAEMVVFENGEVKCQKYWSPIPCKQAPLDINRWLEATWAKLRDAAKTQLPAKEDKLGVALSGGLDSALIAAALRHVSPASRIVGFSLDYGDGGHSELDTAVKIAEYLNMDSHIVQLDAEEIIKDLERLQWLYDEPLIKFTFIPTYYLTKAAEEEVKTLFTGDGGDELFIGYRNDYWEDPMLVSLFSKLGQFRKPLLGVGKSLATPLANWTSSKTLSLAAEFFTREDASHPQWQYRIASRVFHPYFPEEDLAKLFKDGSSPGITKSTVEAINTANTDNSIERISHTMVSGELPNDLLRLDKSIAATGLKIRSPLLDPGMTNFALSIPISLRHRRGTTKHLLRQLIKKYDLLPPEVAAGKQKVGLSAPIHKWLTGSSSRDYFDALLQSSASLPNLDMAYIRRFYPPKTYTQTLKAWNMIAVLLWSQVFLTRHPFPASKVKQRTKH
jgi:asparagine synthase (glutamine-hydrolysing)